MVFLDMSRKRRNAQKKMRGQNEAARVGHAGGRGRIVAESGSAPRDHPALNTASSWCVHARFCASSTKLASKLLCAR